MSKLMNSVHRWNFDKKIKALVSTALIATATIMLLVSLQSSTAALTDQSRSLLQEQNLAVAAGFEDSLNNYKSLAYSLVLDDSVQHYLYNPGDVTRANSARNVLRNTLNMYSSLNFVALVHPNGNFLYKGNGSSFTTRFAEVYSEDYRGCLYSSGAGMHLNYTKSYYNRYTLNVYFPVYDTNYIGKKRGMLCFSFNDSSLEQVLQHQDDSMHSGVAVLSDEGVVMARSSQSGAAEGIDVSWFSGDSGSCQRGGRFYLYQRVSGWPFYVVSSVAAADLYASSRRTVALLLVLVAGAVVLSLLVVNSMVRVLYKPLDKVVRKMDAVANGSLQTRINEQHMGADFKKLAAGFNTMMDKMLLLMDQVKEEQHQMEQIRFNTLQSQIKPHFLYNTLECVHWQAEADGNKEISTLVMALAKYYRICLSEGRDIVSLAEEIECVRSYLIIQNMRYGNIIDSNFDIDPNLENIAIPKLTLQPLVENSIYHGIKVKEGRRGCVVLSARRGGGDIWLTLADTGTGMTQEEVQEINQAISQYDERFGYGVRNVHRRIQLIAGSPYGLHYSRNEKGGVTVTICLPDRPVDED